MYSLPAINLLDHILVLLLADVRLCENENLQALCKVHFPLVKIIVDIAVKHHAIQTFLSNAE